jgi:hypothetical protein
VRRFGPSLFYSSIPLLFCLVICRFIADLVICFAWIHFSSHFSIELSIWVKSSPFLFDLSKHSTNFLHWCLLHARFRIICWFIYFIFRFCFTLCFCSPTESVRVDSSSLCSFHLIAPQICFLFSCVKFDACRYPSLFHWILSSLGIFPLLSRFSKLNSIPLVISSLFTWFALR